MAESVVGDAATEDAVWGPLTHDIIGAGAAIGTAPAVASPRAPFTGPRTLTDELLEEGVVEVGDAVGVASVLQSSQPPLSSCFAV